jgi:hypothetical protein
LNLAPFCFARKWSMIYGQKKFARNFKKWSSFLNRDQLLILRFPPQWGQHLRSPRWEIVIMVGS